MRRNGPQSARWPSAWPDRGVARACGLSWEEERSAVTAVTKAVMGYSAFRLSRALFAGEASCSERSVDPLRAESFDRLPGDVLGDRSRVCISSNRNFAQNVSRKLLWCVRHDGTMRRDNRKREHRVLLS